ncbi:MAG TPA: DUF4412 domain-containing protein [Myxococcaceae bacterium]|nr:DUF4412 domain-containing protein [Myxococcaceae bacterium]
MQRAAILAALFVALPAGAADFEGVITGKTFAKAHDPGTPGGTMRMFVSPAGVRMQVTGEMEMPSRGGSEKKKVSIDFIMLWRSAEPGFHYWINEQNKTYEKKAIEKRESKEKSDIKVERLGTGTVAGRSVEHVKVTGTSGRVEELWVDPSLSFPPSALAALKREENEGGWWQAIQKAGVKGIPLKMTNQDGTSGWEATSVEKKSLPGSLFSIPSDYREAKGYMDMLSPEQAQEMQKMREDAMKNMTPEQRQQMQEMMKKMQQQKSGQ